MTVRETPPLGRPQAAVVELCQEGNQALKSSDLGRAQKAFHSALELDPQSVYALVGLGDTLRKMDSLQEALPHYEKALGLDPDNPFALRGYGDACRGLGRHRPALQAWERYLVRNPTDYYIFTRIGDVQKKLNHYREAENAYARALELHPDDKFALMGMADLCYKMNREEEALTFCQRLLQLGENRFINVLTIMGNIYRRRGEYQVGEGYYRQALEIDSRNTFALFGLGEVLRGEKRYEQAIEVWNQVLVEKPDNENVLARIGDSYLAMGKMEMAEQYYIKSNAVAPNDFARIGLLRIRRKRKENDAVAGEYEEMFRQNPDGIRIASDLVDVYMEKGDREKAFEVIKTLCQRAERDKDRAKKLLPMLRQKLERHLFGMPGSEEF